MILVADDNEDNLQIISRIVMDIMMPEMSGTEVLAKLRESPHTSRIPVILLTAMAQNDDVIASYQNGADYYMTKPYTAKELVNGVRLVLGHTPTTTA